MRREERQRVSRPARIELDNGSIVLCRIANVSRGGALLLVPDSEWLPKTFHLTDTFSNIRREVRIVWTSPNCAGLRYIDARAAPQKRQIGFGKRAS